MRDRIDSYGLLWKAVKIGQMGDIKSCYMVKLLGDKGV